MKSTLSKLFDYQKFDGNRKLQDVIDSVHRRQRELITDGTELVNAAGTAYFQPSNDDREKRRP